jgi:hypothetical protein
MRWAPSSFELDQQRQRDQQASQERIARDQNAASRYNADANYRLAATEWAQQAAAAVHIKTGLTSLVNAYNMSYDQAKASNQARYNQMLGIADQTTGQRAADITSQYGQQSANSMQNLQRLGMANTTVAPTMNVGIQREKSSALNTLADQMQATKLGIINNYGNTMQSNLPSSEGMRNLLGAIGNTTGTFGAAAVGTALGGLRV